ncbi:hypothetical protein CYMTET_11414 [Cymbomonas tetramitiformis]|uniref:CCR4-NOT transcription complex subunit 4 n=1 Tax=Cymbomonas tetramitiformis TaxID=36881 RepID=A0AAE0GMQ4_9CHLO|nr:hypothetical protein CYMTET_11414 [Cymbomonas tetramitiformis]
MENKEDEQHDSCPLCTEDLDATDKNFRPCPCGYQICAWCWHQVMELAAKDNTLGRCPACRAEYKKEDITFQAPNPEELSKKSKKVKTPKSKAPNGTLSRKHLANVRVIQRNLVYVIGLSLNYCKDEVLKKSEYFGKHGKIIKVSVNRNGVYNSANGGTPTGSAYVTFFRGEDALKCITAVDGSILDGKVLRACFGTTKYCNSFLKYQPCNNPDCLYLHDLGDDGDSFTKEEMVARKHQQFHEATHPGEFPEDGDSQDGSPEASGPSGVEADYHSSPVPQQPLFQSTSQQGTSQPVMHTPPPSQASQGFGMWPASPSPADHGALHTHTQSAFYGFQGAPAAQVPQGFDTGYSLGSRPAAPSSNFQHSQLSPARSLPTPPLPAFGPAQHLPHPSQLPPAANSFPDGLFSESVPLEALLSSPGPPLPPAADTTPGLAPHSPAYAGGFPGGLYGGLDATGGAFNGFNAGAGNLTQSPYSSRFSFGPSHDGFGSPAPTSPSSGQSRFEFARSAGDAGQGYGSHGDTDQQSTSHGGASLFQGECFFRALLPNVSVSFNSNPSAEQWLQHPADASTSVQAGLAYQDPNMTGGSKISSLHLPFNSLHLDSDGQQQAQQDLPAQTRLQTPHEENLDGISSQGRHPAAVGLDPAIMGASKNFRMQPARPINTGRTPPPGFGGGAAKAGPSGITAEHTGLAARQQEALRGAPQ